MKLTTFLLLILCQHVSAKTFSQEITLSLNNTGLETVFKEIRKQTDYKFIYTKEQLGSSQKVSIEVTKASLETVLQICLKNQPLTYVIEDKVIVIRSKEKVTEAVNALLQLPDITGRIINEHGEALAGVTITVKGKNQGTATTDKGEFILKDVEPDAVLVISSVGYQTQEIRLQGKTIITVQLKLSISSLDETVVIAYGTTTKRLNTGSISKVSADDISKQPVSNPLAAMEGRVPGLLINQTSGLNGARFKVQLRGQNSLLQGSEPFFIIDGVPYSPGNNSLNLVTNATDADGLSPFNLINPDDIESIEVLKDADATAIYGSRAANGVILITTKKGKEGKTRIRANVYSGFSKVGREVKLMNTKEYLAMRKEAFASDGILPTTYNAPDLLLWDTTRYTDFRKLLTGGTAHTLDAQLSASGGNSNNQFYLGGGYHRETTVLPTSLADQRASVHFSFNHKSTDEKLSILLSSFYNSNLNRITARDMTAFINKSPNFKLFTESGDLNWEENGVTYSSLSISEPNPMALLKRVYRGSFQNFNNSLTIGYKLLPGLNIRVNLGYNAVSGNEVNLNPGTSIDPHSGQLPFSNFANSNQKSWIVEPQAEYKKQLKKAVLSLLVGSTWQENKSNAIVISARDYSSDLLLTSVSGAGSVSSYNSEEQYRYEAIFARLNYNLDNKYILNLSGRRDGSSRFGPDKQFANFGAAGFAWIFSSEKIIQKIAPFIGYGKLRGSYGITGNDQIGNYKFLDTWSSSSDTYQGLTSLVPTSLFNPDYAWEINRKLEAALEIGILKDKIFLTVAWYRNRSGNQLINYTLPIQTGFSFIGKNLDAEIQNQGFEVSLSSQNIQTKRFRWISTFSVTANRNKLVSFPGLPATSYAHTYIEGKSLNARAVYHYQGIDKSTGIYKIQDVNSDGSYDYNDQISVVSTDPKFFGGFLNSISYANFRVSIFFEFRKQLGVNYLPRLGVPGFTYNNMPEAVLNHWQKSGDDASFQRYTATTGDAWLTGTYYFPSSDAVYTDASFIRCKNISVSYGLPPAVLHRMKMQSLRIYVQGQNLFTITSYKGADPENQNMLVLPPLRTITAGIELTF